MNFQKHLFITGTSSISWKDAIVKTILETSKTICNLSDVKILNQYAHINKDKICEYFVDLDLSFCIDESKRSNCEESQDQDQ